MEFAGWAHEKPNRLHYALKKIPKMCTEFRAYPGADCGSDHNVVGAELKLRFKKHGKTEYGIIYDLDKLQISAIRDGYTVEVNNRFETLLGCEEEKSPNELWEVIKEDGREVAGEEKEEKEQAMVTPGTLKLIETR